MTAAECTVQFTDKQSARSFFMSKEAITLFVAIRNPLLYGVKAAHSRGEDGPRPYGELRGFFVDLFQVDKCSFLSWIETIGG